MSIIVMLVGPIEYWWDTPDDPDRFNSQPAVEYRHWRQILRDALVAEGFLVYSPHDAFKGTWDERAQAHNDAILQLCDVVVNMRPAGVSGKGTDHELELAGILNKPVIYAPPWSDLNKVASDITVSILKRRFAL
jgi:hypothetical protein